MLGPNSSPLSVYTAETATNSEQEKKTDKSNKIKPKGARISTELKTALLAKFFFENKKIKSAASELNIKYSSAKTIVYSYRKKVRRMKKSKKIQKLKRCAFEEFDEGKEIKRIQIVVTQGGIKLNRKRNTPEK